MKPQPWSTPEITSVGRQPAHSIVHTDRVELDGVWDFELLPRPDAAPTGDWRSIVVPGAWTMQDTWDKPHYTNVRMPFPEAPPHVPQDNPTGLYRRTFVVPETWSGRRVVLHVGAAESVLLVELNGVDIGVSKDSHLAAEFDVTDHIQSGSNELRLTVVKWSDASFIEDQDQWWHGGLTRSVYLYATSPVFLRDVRTHADRDPETGLATLAVTVQVGAPGDAVPDGYAVVVEFAGRSASAPAPVRAGNGGHASVVEAPTIDGLDAFTAHYLDHTRPYELLAYTHSSEEDTDQIAARVSVDGEERVIEGEGNGPLSALVDAFGKAFGVTISLRDYHEHTMAARVDAQAAAYVEVDVDDEAFWGVGVHGSILTASLRAIVNAVNRSVAAGQPTRE